MSSLSCTLPKSSRLLSKAPMKRLDPIAFPGFLPFACWNSKSSSYGPRDNVCPCPFSEKDQFPSLSLNAKENDRVNPGPMDVTPLFGSMVEPVLVLIVAVSPPTGMADSLVKSIKTSTISSSSSSISILTDCRNAVNEPAVTICSSVTGPTYPSYTVLHFKFKRVSLGKDQSTAATV